jgi:squalene/oxidosqualene cyclase-like protein
MSELFNENFDYMLWISFVGINSIPTEMWFLPRWSPLHPGKMWCHARMVYLPMGYLYSSRFTPDVQSDPLLLALRKELYLEDYDSICWDNFRQTCADIDNYSPLNPVMGFLQNCLSYYEYFLPSIPFLVNMRKRSLAYVMSYIHAEDIQTNFVDIGPVNKALNMLCVYVDGGCDNSNEQFLRHLPRVDDYLWVAEDGMKMQGYNGSQCWDTSFAVQAIVEGNLVERFPECSKKIYSYLNRTQIADDEVDREKYFRQVSKGGWPFSTAAHGWPISDCTAEGLKGVLALHSAFQGMSSELSVAPADMIPQSRLCDAVNVILELHNEDGGWATYENNRGYRWYELMNPSEVFGDIMIDYSYVECTSACITALSKFHKVYPNHRTNQVLQAIEAGRTFLISIQRPDGSWYGSWGVCMTYGTWFGIEGLISAGESPQSEAIQKAMQFMLSKQNPNGGWGEGYVACVDKAYPSDGTGQYGEDGSGVVQTAWAVLALLAGGCNDKAAIDAGVRYIRKKQLSSGDWAQEGITGVFNRSCGITYTAYRNVFTIWALVRYANAYEK